MLDLLKIINTQILIARQNLEAEDKKRLNRSEKSPTEKIREILIAKECEFTLEKLQDLIEQMKNSATGLTEKDIVEKLQNYLKTRWERIKNTLFQYTTLHDHPLTILLLKIAILIDEHKKGEFYPYYYLMPTLKGDLSSEQKERLKNYGLHQLIVSKDEQSLIPVELLAQETLVKKASEGTVEIKEIKNEIFKTNLFLDEKRKTVHPVFYKTAEFDDDLSSLARHSETALQFHQLLLEELDENLYEEETSKKEIEKKKTTFTAKLQNKDYTGHQDIDFLPVKIGALHLPEIPGISHTSSTMSDEFVDSYRNALMAIKDPTEREKTADALIDAQIKLGIMPILINKVYFWNVVRSLSLAKFTEFSTWYKKNISLVKRKELLPDTLPFNKGDNNFAEKCIQFYNLFKTAKALNDEIINILVTEDNQETTDETIKTLLEEYFKTATFSDFFNKLQVKFAQRLKPEEIDETPSAFKIRQHGLLQFKQKLLSEGMKIAKINFTAEYFSNHFAESLKKNLSEEETEMKKIKILLDYYTRSDSRLDRFFYGNWNRHHIKEIAAISAKISKGELKTKEEVLNELHGIKLTNFKGSLNIIINYIRAGMPQLETQPRPVLYELHLRKK